MQNKLPPRPDARTRKPAASPTRVRVVQAGPVPRRTRVADGTPRPRGRPPKGSGGDARAALLAAARDLFVRYGYRAVSARQIAKLAGVDASLLSYYFTGKNGLYREVLGQALAPVFAAAAALGAPTGADAGPDAEPGANARVAPPAGSAAADPGELVERVVAAYMRVLAANPWIPGLIIREVLTGTGSYRAQFVRDFPSRIAPFAVESIRRASAAGRFRPGLDPRLALVSCIGMAVMPFIAAPVFASVFGDDLARDPERLITHTLDMVRHALRVPQ